MGQITHTQKIGHSLELPLCLTIYQFNPYELLLVVVTRSKKLKFKPYGKASPIYGTVSAPLPSLGQIEIILYYQWDIKIKFLHSDSTNTTKRNTSIVRTPSKIDSTELNYVIDLINALCTAMAS